MHLSTRTFFQQTATSDFSHHCNYPISHCLNLKGGMPPRNDSCNLPWACLNERLSCISLMPYDVGGSGDCFFRSVSHQLYGTAELHFEICMTGINHLNNHPEIYIESFSDKKITFNKCQHQGHMV